MTALRKYTFHDGKELELGKRTLVMGVLNVTPDSFSDGGKWNTHDKALRHMEEMVRDGADIIDIGAESSRPGFQTMPAQQEIERLMPFLEAVLKECPVPISVDTFKAETAREAAKAGCHMLNDIWGLQYKEEPKAMAEVAAEAGLPIVVMHNQDGKAYARDIIETMKDFFRRTIEIADHAGVPRNHLILDPGIGFGKTPEGNLTVLRRQQELLTIDGVEYPLLLGTSRKSFIGAALGLIFLLLRIPLPQPVEKTVSDIGGMATPYCLIVLGGSIRLSRFGDYGRSLWLAVLGKSVIIPLVFIPLVVLAGFRGDALAALAVMLACPTAVSGYTLANQCGADGELAAQLIVVTTLFSVVTMFLTIWVLTSMALI